MAKPTHPVHPRGSGERHKILQLFIATSRFIPAGAGNACQMRGCMPKKSVHPRGSGERARSPPVASSNRGSSPRERGTPSLRSSVAGDGRFIPAGAGNARVMRGFGTARAVHPRGSGERYRTMEPDGMRTGSSPRERGTRYAVGLVGAIMRFIPAGAGNARAQSGRHPPATVHPRGSGERDSGCIEPFDGDGSSPRERGTLHASQT